MQMRWRWWRWNHTYRNVARDTNSNEHGETFVDVMTMRCLFVVCLIWNKNALPDPSEEVSQDLWGPIWSVSSADIPHVNKMRIMVPMNSARNSLCYNIVWVTGYIVSFCILTFCLKCLKCDTMVAQRLLRDVFRSSVLLSIVSETELA